MADEMPKKRESKNKESAAPKFDGFKPLAGLKGLKEELAKKQTAETSAAKDGPTGTGSVKSNAPPRPTANRTARDRDRAPSQAEDDLSFHRMMAGVTPLASGKERVAVSQVARTTRDGHRGAEARAKVQAETDAVLEHLHQLVDEPARFEVTDDGRRVEGRRLDTAPQLVRSLRRGLLPIDARLDLHGLTAEAAREKVLGFLRETRARGERCVLIIHGKGERHPGAGVLRGEIGAWLSQGRAREHVAAFVTATEADGGEGAVYVALRR